MSREMIVVTMNEKRPKEQSVSREMMPGTMSEREGPKEMSVSRKMNPGTMSKREGPSQ